MGDVDADPVPVQLLRSNQRRAAAAEGVKNDVARVRRCRDDPFQESQRLLGCPAQSLLGPRDYGLHSLVCPNVLKWHSLHLVQVPLVAREPVRREVDPPFGNKRVQLLLRETPVRSLWRLTQNTSESARRTRAGSSHVSTGVAAPARVLIVVVPIDIV